MAVAPTPGKGGQKFRYNRGVYPWTPTVAIWVEL